LSEPFKLTPRELRIASGAKSVIFKIPPQMDSCHRHTRGQSGVVRPSIGHVYGYLLEPLDDATLVTSYYDWSNISQEWRDADIFPVISESALRATLGILDRNVTRGGTASKG
jgi:hypothetical protein